ncbi:MAG: efflux RND transporter periplasmic adaptor subunit [Candidatus Koribacter versatilis]|uniref:Efflux RND transporter periplasmic adaptor subunit n=1 Tax=Candidatus Korobacter versatilis TaxID=658062 RepID=A0A932A6M5_9BACT|nr:efflux RND transporter periplasmic adaptor subunit [Candidatus Koribacter versatilis]
MGVGENMVADAMVNSKRRKTALKRHFMNLALLLSAAAMAGCSGTNAAANKPSAPAPKPVVTTAAATPTTENDGVVASGPLIVENQVEVEAQREGMVSHISVDTGTLVQKGQLLGELDNRQVMADRDAAASRVKSLEFDVKGWEYETKVLEADLARAEKMWEAQLITKQDLDHTRYKVEADRFETERYRANLESARQQLKTAELELAKTRIVAPFPGVVGRRYVRVGDKVTMGERLFWVTQTAPLRMRFTLPEKYVGKIHKGDMLTVTITDAPEVKHSARILLVSPVIDPASGTIEVSAEVMPPLGDLKPGMSATVSFSPK